MIPLFNQNYLLKSTTQLESNLVTYYQSAKNKKKKTIVFMLAAPKHHLLSIKENYSYIFILVAI